MLRPPKPQAGGNFSNHDADQLVLAVLSTNGLLAEIIPGKLYWTSQPNVPADDGKFHYFSTV
jgi:hypothetical protein